MIVYFFSECQKKDDRIKNLIFVRSRNDHTFLVIVKKVQSNIKIQVL
jgi:hypothetical protein